MSWKIIDMHISWLITARQMIIALAPLILYTLSVALPNILENVTEISKWRHRHRHRHRQSLSQVFNKSP